MRKSVLCIFIMISTSLSCAAFDYTISDVYYSGTLTLNSQSVQITGSGAYSIEAYGSSYVEILNTLPLQTGVGGVRRTYLYGTSELNLRGGIVDAVPASEHSVLNVSGGKITDSLVTGNANVNMSGGDVGSFLMRNNSKLNVSAGDLRWLGIYDDSIAVLKGGNINTISSQQSPSTVKHITMICDVDSVSISNNLLTGKWLDGSSFSISLYNQAGYSSVYSNIQFIPEPATLVLLAAGGLLLRRRKANCV
jgi:hypothetical protein